MSIKKTILFPVFLLLVCSIGISQDRPEKENQNKQLKINLNEDGSKYLRFLLWNQVWLSSNDLSNSNTDFQLSTSLRRSRVLVIGQVTPKILILTHFGQNSLNTENLSSLGSGSTVPRFFLHSAWSEIKLSNSFYVGAGLHYWNGLSRLASYSSTTSMTLDQSRPYNAWHSLGISDQFARHLGIYLKGSTGKFEYRVAWNTPGQSPLGDGKDYSNLFTLDDVVLSSLSYNGISEPTSSGQQKGRAVYSGYVKYNFLENESMKLPYYTGTYLGKKKVLAVGAGFFFHPNGMYDTAKEEHSSVKHLAVDVFMDYPLPRDLINAYVSVHNFDYGEGYISRWGGTGRAVYGQVGYCFASRKIMPYIAYSASDYEGASDFIEAMNVGVNYFIKGHNCKITAEYHSILKDYRESALTIGGQDRFSQFRIQLHVMI
ncbi:MAG: hypothetical protein HKN16_09380 [Saprospiraceae bacterium]|nr:hypothetical protein [Saprospiraceae bacterium]